MPYFVTIDGVMRLLATGGPPVSYAPLSCWRHARWNAARLRSGEVSASRKRTTDDGDRAFSSHRQLTRAGLERFASQPLPDGSKVRWPELQLIRGSHPAATNASTKFWI